MSSLITVRAAAESRDLTDLDTIKDVLGITDQEQDAKLRRLIKAASGMVEDYTGRVFGRELITEKLGVDVDTAIGSHADSIATRLMVSRTPILMVEAARFDGDAVDVTTVDIEDPEAGFLFRSEGFSETLIEHQGIMTTRTRVLEPLWEIDYSAGFVLPSFAAIDFTFVSGDVDIANNQISKATHGMLAGDTVRFTTDGVLPAGLSLNRDYFIRDEAAGTFKVADQHGGPVVDITDTGTGTHTLTRIKTFPASLEEDVINLVVSLNSQTTRDDSIRSEKLGDYAVTYAGASDIKSTGGLPPQIASRLDRWRDLA